jgi:hypothetical protein
MAELMTTKDEENVISLIVADLHVIRILNKVKLTVSCILDIFHCFVLIKKSVLEAGWLLSSTEGMKYCISGDGG